MIPNKASPVCKTCNFHLIFTFYSTFMIIEQCLRIGGCRQCQSLIFFQASLRCEFYRIVVSLSPLLQQALDKLLETEPFLFVFFIRPQLPKRPWSNGP